MPLPDDQPTAPVANRRRRSRLAAAALAVVLGIGGASMIGYAVTQQQVAPAPTSADAGTQARQQPSASPSPPPSTTPPRAAAMLPAATPTAIEIPAINLSAAVNSVGLNPDDTMEVPQPGPLYDQAAWYRYSPTPGEMGPSVIIGHVDSAEDGPSVFFNLGELTPGQRIQVARADGITATFEVDAVRSYPKTSFPIGTVYGDTDRAGLRLITCGGSFDETVGEYRDNIVVFAHLVGNDSAGQS